MRRGGGRLVVALCALAGCLGCPQKPPLEITGISGKEVTLVPEVSGNLTTITWKEKENIVAEWDDTTSFTGTWFAPRLTDRAKLNRTSGSLTFIKLQHNDTGEYTAEASVGGEIQCTFFSVQMLEPPKPPQLNCTAVGDRIQVSCELDAQDVAQKIIPTYRWKYQESNKEIPGNTSVILIEKDVDPSKNITCVISVYNANSSSSIRLKGCTPRGTALQRRNRTWLLAPFFLTPGCLGVMHYLWKRGCFSIKRKGKSQDCEDRGTGADGTPPEQQHLHEELPENLEENNRERPSDHGT